jgi:hypothetical protein
MVDRGLKLNLVLPLSTLLREDRKTVPHEILRANVSSEHESSPVSDPVYEAHRDARYEGNPGVVKK